MDNHTKINVVLYYPKTLAGIKKLVNIFRECKLENIDKERIYDLYEKGEGEIGFFIKDSTWIVCGINEDMQRWFNVTEVIVLE